MKNIKHIVKKILLSSLDVAGFHIFARKFQRTPIVLFWHGVSDHPDLDIEGESFPVDLFEKQIKYIASNYDVISMDEFAYRYENKSFTNREIVITFDDGYKDNLLIAAPILKKLNLPFTIFVSAHNVDAKERFYISIPRLVIIGGELDHVDLQTIKYSKRLYTRKERIACAHEIEYSIKYLTHEKAKQVSKELIDLCGKERFNNLCIKYNNGQLLSWNDIKTLVREYDCTIGSHCYDHCICHDKQDKDIVKEQILSSKQLIEEKTGYECKYFAYPNGDYTPYSDKIVRDVYNLGFSTKEVAVFNKSTTRSSIGRIGVPCSFDEFKYFLSRYVLTTR